MSQSQINSTFLVLIFIVMAWANTIGGFALGGFNQTSAVVAD
jgi:hypothetical protein